MYFQCKNVLTQILMIYEITCKRILKKYHFYLGTRSMHDVLFSDIRVRRIKTCTMLRLTFIGTTAISPGISAAYNEHKTNYMCIPLLKNYIYPYCWKMSRYTSVYRY